MQIKNPREGLPKKLLELIKEFSKITKVNNLKNQLFYYLPTINVGQLSVKYIYIASKAIQFLGTNGRKSVQEIYTENYKSQIRGIRDLNK